MNLELVTHPADRELRQAIAELSLISHASTGAYDGKITADTGEDIGGKRPPGGDVDRPGRSADMDERAAWLVSYQRKTPDFFRREREKCQTDGRLIALRDECRTVIEAWRRQPMPAGQPPEFGSPQWKRWVAESDKDGGELARLFNTTRQYIHQIRKDYRVAA